MSNKPSTSTVDFSSTLCLACSSSLPSKSSQIFTTGCCNRPICPSCLSSNPRLARYDPCLACLGGVGAINAGSSKGKRMPGQNFVNVDGAVRDEDTFVLGDDEEDESGDERIRTSERCGSASSPSSYLPIVESAPSAPRTTQEPTEDTTGPTTDPSTSSKYYIKPNDNLQGIALRFGVNGRELCRLNKLPPSTLSTTPHILHTRAFITLPSSSQLKSQPPANDSNPIVDTKREARLVRERTQKRLQTLTKEVDWRVANAYVALADVPDLDADMKWKESTVRENEMNKSGSASWEGDVNSKSTLEGRAVDQYLDDEEWEQKERREGRTVAIPPFPYFNGWKQDVSMGNSRSGWSIWSGKFES